MNNDWLIGRRGQALAVSIALIGAAILWVGLVDPLWTWHAERAERLEQQRTVVQHMSELVDTLPALRRTAAFGERDALPASAMLQSTSDALAGAMLQERVQAMGAASGVTVTSVETLPGEAIGTARRIGLRMSLTAEWPVLVALLRAFDQATPRMLVDDLRIHSATVVSRPQTLPLQASLTVHAYRSVAPNASVTN